MISNAELTGRLGLDRCVGCGSCTDVCPSARNGGVVPDEVVRSVLDGNDAKDIWKCLVCHRCSEVCPFGIDVSQMMICLRNSSDDVPDRFRKTGKQMFEKGRLFTMAGRAESMRKELGLPVGDVDESALDEVRKILKGAGFDE
ncbi:MAG: 4Fe-4S dicluster domain-containing protein [Candidatus Methanomethylophilaceae archaeon]